MHIWRHRNNKFDMNGALEVPLERIMARAATVHLLVQTEREKDYLLGLQLMFGVELKVNTINQFGLLQGIPAYISISGLPPT